LACPVEALMFYFCSGFGDVADLQELKRGEADLEV
jgi:hypothetical protein